VATNGAGEGPRGFPGVRAKALGGLGFILLFQQDYGPAIATLEEAVALYKELGDRSGAAFALASLGWAVLHGFYHERVPAFLRESEALIEGGLEGPPVLTWVSRWPPPRSGRVTSTWRPPGLKRPSPCAGSCAT
jgi:hypothetical protein